MSDATQRFRTSEETREEAREVSRTAYQQKIIDNNSREKQERTIAENMEYLEEWRLENPDKSELYKILKGFN